ncbi:hypothetical protein BD293_4498 [Roseinatronobacter monicus]|uniref:Uncharacterized protein n=1 Tax=Roseinatronobacter monicus TaxID=393481 RepID=A0A543K347_9RHOB|nr:hypothetical protein BD293_4498 [Roseinatronobacter monicus]
MAYEFTVLRRQHIMKAAGLHAILERRQSALCCQSVWRPVFTEAAIRIRRSRTVLSNAPSSTSAQKTHSLRI